MTGHLLTRSLAVLFLAVGSLHASAEIVDPATGIIFPDHIGKMRLKDRHAFDNARLGAVIRYDEEGRSLAEGGLTVGVYVYDAGQAHVSGDTRSPQLQAHFHQVISEVKMMETLGKVSAVRLPPDGEHETALPGCGPQFLWERYEIDLDPGRTLNSATYLAGVHDNFIKLRISYRLGDATAATIAQDFVAGLRHVLGGCAV